MNVSKNRFSEKAAKSEENEPTIFLEIIHFGSHFSLNIDGKIDAKIDTEKVMTIDEKSTRKWYRN